MESKMGRRILKFRAFISLSILWSFLIEAISGIVLYVTPVGRVANWTNWKFWGLTKQDWEAIHTIFGYVFLLFAGFHIYNNWNAILNYVKKRIKQNFKMRVELITSFLLAICIFLGVLVNIPPFSSIMNFGDTLKNTWPENRNQPFLVRPEKLSFERFIKELGIPIEIANDLLKQNGILIREQSQLVQDIAKKNKVSPSDIYEMLKPGIPPYLQKKEGRLARKNEVDSTKNP